MPYSVSKGGINQLTKVMALSLAPYGIRVNAIGPGSIMTDMLASGERPTRRRRTASCRARRSAASASPTEIAAIAAFLASDDASYITGQTIYADGGRLPLNYTVPVKDLTPSPPPECGLSAALLTDCCQDGCAILPLNKEDSP